MAFDKKYLDFCSVKVGYHNGSVEVIYDMWGSCATLDGIGACGPNSQIIYCNWLPNQQIEVGIGREDGQGDMEIRHYSSLSDWKLIEYKKR